MRDLLRQRNVSLVLADCSIFGFVLGLALLVVPLYTLSLSDSPLVLATVVAVFPLTAVLLSLASGAVSEAIGSRSILVAGFSLMSVGCLVLAAARSWPVVLLGQFLLGLGDVAYWIPAFALLARLAPAGKHYTVQGLGSSTQQIGTIVGPFVGGLLIGVAGFPAAFLVGAALSLAGLVVALAMKPIGDRCQSRLNVGAFLLFYHRKALGVLFRNPAVLWTNLVHAATLVSWPVMRGSFYLAYLAVRGLSSSASGAIVSGHLLVGSVAAAGLGRLSAGRSMPRLLLGIAAFGALTVGVTPLLNSIPLIVLVGCAGGVVALYNPALVGFLSEEAGLAERSMGVALLNLSWAVVSPMGVLLVGVLVDRVSLSAGFFITEALALGSVGLLWLWAEKRLV
ncbi:MAG TPA: MFS transporter [Chloroflexi bacterium]|nr:MFS transporter [Chloroflexota bacterium]